MQSQVFHLASGQSYDLSGHNEEVFALAAANQMLFSGGKDQSIRVWSFNIQTGVFAPSVSPNPGSYIALLVTHSAENLTHKLRKGCSILLLRELTQLACEL